MNQIQRERLFELLADQTIFGLDKEESLELDRLKKQFPEWENEFSLEQAASSIGLIDLDTSEPLPANLRAKILADAEDYFSTAKKSRNVVSFPTKSTEASGVQANGKFENFAPAENNRRPFRQWLGWGIAAAACIALAVNLWLTSTKPPVETVKTVEVVKSPTPEPPAAERRAQLLASAPDAVQTEWTAPNDDKKVLGDIVWSNERQKGFLHFRGLPPNDAQRETYQLWIVDETQDPKTPVDGGTFDVAANGEVVIAIDAKLKIRKPKAFAVTREKPGGVVVSKQEAVVAVAKI